MLANLSCGRGIPAPIHRLCGWLVEQDRREDAVALMTWFAEHGPPAPRTTGPDGVVRLDIPSSVLAPGSVAPEARLSMRSTVVSASSKRAVRLMTLSVLKRKCGLIWACRAL